MLRSIVCLAALGLLAPAAAQCPHLAYLSQTGRLLDAQRGTDATKPTKLAAAR